jgi:hypothetical protein
VPVVELIRQKLPHARRVGPVVEMIDAMRGFSRRTIYASHSRRCPIK